jgi:hypothetical protein
MSRPSSPAATPWPLAKILAGVAVVLLAALSAFWPRGGGARDAGTFLVLDPSLGARQRQVYQPLADYCGEVLGRNLQATVVARTSEFLAAAPLATLMLCPDAVAMRTRGAAALAVGRRRAPQNLRPMSVLVSRAGAASDPRPWLVAPSRTVFGDSLSLVCLVPLCARRSGASWPEGVSFGRDPYDHGAVLEALRLGAFDYAVVRQWAAEAFVAGGGSDAAAWQVVPLTEPLPDIVLLVDARLPGQLRLTLGEAVVTLGRRNDATTRCRRADWWHGRRWRRSIWMVSASCWNPTSRLCATDTALAGPLRANRPYCACRGAGWWWARRLSLW